MTSVQTPTLGQAWPEQGGIYVGLMRGENGQPDYHLIVGEVTGSSLAWGAYGDDEPGATSARDGLANTKALVESKHDHPAAKWAAGLEHAGFADWYLPSQGELMLCFVNAREAFEPKWHWSSTQYSRNCAWFQFFAGGTASINYKAYEGQARAVRRFSF